LRCRSITLLFPGFFPCLFQTVCCLLSSSHAASPSFHPMTPLSFTSPILFSPRLRLFFSPLSFFFFHVCLLCSLSPPPILFQRFLISGPFSSLCAFSFCLSSSFCPLFHLLLFFCGFAPVIRSPRIFEFYFFSLFWSPFFYNLFSISSCFSVPFDSLIQLPPYSVSFVLFFIYPYPS